MAGLVFGNLENPLNTGDAWLGLWKLSSYAEDAWLLWVLEAFQENPGANDADDAWLAWFLKALQEDAWSK